MDITQFITSIEPYLQNQYIRAGFIMAIVLLVLRPLLFSLEKIVLSFTKKTKTTVDDQFVVKAYKPVAFILILVGLRIALEEITMPFITEKYISLAIYSLIGIACAYIVYYFADIVLLAALRFAANRDSSKTRKSLIPLISGFLKITLSFFVILFILSLWGVEIGPFLAGLGIAGLAVALALQPTLANIFSGLAMILDKTIKEGDVVFLNAETRGKVQEIGIRSTRLITFDNELIIIPNSTVAAAKVQNIVLPEPKSRVVIPFTVAYGSDIEKVRKIVRKLIDQIEHVSKDSEPSVRFTEMQNSALLFKAYFYVDSYEYRFASVDKANTLIYNALRKNKIEIPFPQMDVHIKKK